MLTIVQGDITMQHVDVIVNAANSTLLGGGGVDGAIHKVAGPALKQECASLHGCVPGDAKITLGYGLPARYVIHTVGPIWHNGREHEAEVLQHCYAASLKLAYENQLHTIAFPSISTGAYHYPVSEAARIALDTIMRALIILILRYGWCYGMMIPIVSINNNMNKERRKNKDA